MKQEKVKTYKMSISRVFPAIHPRAGEKTNFAEKIGVSVHETPIYGNFYKLHTIRSNYPLWKKRIDEVNAGKAVLVLFEWEEKPYRSNHRDLFRFDKNSGISVQKIEFGTNLEDNNFFVIKRGSEILSMYYNINRLANNDGLSLEDFNNWFKNYDLSEPMAIIHFTKFRY